MSQPDTPSPPAPPAPPANDPRECLSMLSCPLFRPCHLGNVPDGAHWIWHGYLAGGQITLLTGQWKIGKTALLSSLLARLGTGGQLAGRDVRAGRAVVLTEENPIPWRMRCGAFGIGENVSFAFRPFVGRPPLQHWKFMAESVILLHRQKPVDLLVIDPLATLWPCRDENNAAGVMEALEPLRDVADRRIAILLLHHPRKEQAGGGREARGSGAMSAFVDFLIEMNWYARPDEPDRRRRLLAWSRYDATPRQWIIELTADGRDYVQGTADAPGAALASIVRQLLEAELNLSARDLLTRWPPDSPPPQLTVLNRYLSQAVAEDEIICTGAGHRYEPYRYQLAEREANSGGRD